MLVGKCYPLSIQPELWCGHSHKRDYGAAGCSGDLSLDTSKQRTNIFVPKHSMKKEDTFIQRTPLYDGRPNWLYHRCLLNSGFTALGNCVQFGEGPMNGMKASINAVYI